MALASAITAYARTHMRPYKLDPSVLIMTQTQYSHKIRFKLIKVGKELGLFKDELSP